MVRVPHMNYYGLVTWIISSDGVSKSWPGITVLKYLQWIGGNIDEMEAGKQMKCAHKIEPQNRKDAPLAELDVSNVEVFKLASLLVLEMPFIDLLGSCRAQPWES